jgi:TolB protein
MNRIWPAVLVLLVSIGCATAAQQQIAFERGTDIWIANADGSNPKKVTKGTGPDLSPDGKRIAYHTDVSTGKDLVRRIAVFDLTSNKATVFKDQIPSDNCHRAVWSPDGEKILFSIWSDNDWHLGLINADGTGFRFFRKTPAKGDSIWSYCWSPDGKSVYGQDLDNLFQLDPDGKEVHKWNLKTLFPDGSFNSGSSMSVSLDGKTFLMEVDMDNEEANMPDWDGPPPSLWSLGIDSERTNRLSPKGVLAWRPSWLDANSYVFSSQTAKEKTPSIYRGAVGNPERKRIITNANNPTVSRP